MGRVLLIFIDGLGLGPSDSPCNPLARFSPRVLNCFSDRLGPLPRDGICIPVDTCLRVIGIPQSATGQATLFTGVNAAELLGRHLSGFPNQELRALLAQESFVQRLSKRNCSVNFANTYTPAFFENRPRWVSVTTWVCESAGLRLNVLPDLLAERSLYMDFTNRLLVNDGHNVPVWTPEKAADVLARQARAYDVCFYEYFLCDVAGHRGTPEQNETIVRELDEFLSHVVDRLDLEDSSLVITSDHGNIEDSCVAGHTANPVPGLFWGPIQERVNGRSRLDLTEIAPLIEA
ncbi:MAG: peptidase, partial [Acidobacteria bacterium]